MSRRGWYHTFTSLALAGWLFLRFAILLQASPTGLQSPDALPEYVPNSFIVEFNPEKVEEDAWKSTLESFVSTMSKRLAMDVTVTHEYDSREIHLGATIQLHPLSRSAMDWSISTLGLRMITDTLKDSHGVQRVTRNQFIHPPKRGLHDQPAWATADRSIQERAALKRGISAGHPRDIRRRTMADAGSSLAIHKMVGIDIQHKRGNFGAGVLVCIIDGLVDFSHPALNGGKPAGVDCLGGDCPVQGGYDFVGPKFDYVHRHPGPPKSINACGHATHVAGIIAGRDPDNRFKGIAPDVKLRTYGIYSCSFVPFNTSSGGTTIADGFGVYNLAYKDNCDVLSGSLSYTRGWQDAEAQLASRLSRRGVTSVFSTGNDGDSGPFLSGSPALGEDVIAVGSVDSTNFPSWALAIHPALPDGTKTLRVFTEASWIYNRTIPPLPLRFSKAALANASIADEACSPLGADIPAGDDFILVIFQSTVCGYQKQVNQVAEKGVKYLLRITAEGTPLFAYPTEPIAKNNKTVTMGMLDTKQGKALYEAYKANPSIKATFSPGGSFDVLNDWPHPTAGLMSYFSSWGPDNELKLVKPDVVAVGSATLSSVPLPVRYAISAGNSFSTPTVSGAVALYKSAKGRKVSTLAIKRALKHTTSKVKRRTGGHESLFWAGAGLVNITAAIDLTTDVDPTDLVFGDKPVEFHREILVTNVGKHNQSYNVTHVPVQSVFLLEKGAPEKRTTVDSSMVSSVPQDADEVATVDFDGQVFDLAPGETKFFSIRLMPPHEHPRIIMYSGYLNIESLNDPRGTVNLPYTGISGSLASIPVLVSGPTPFSTNLPGLYTPDNTEQIRNDSTRWALDGPSTSPNLVMMAQTPSQRIVVDLVEDGIDLQPTIPIIDDVDCCNVTFVPERRRSIAQEDHVYHLPKLTRNSMGEFVNFSSIPIVGRISDTDILPRDLYYKTILLEGGFRAYPISTSTLYDPTLSTTSQPSPPPPITLEQGKSYRVLLRVHRFHSGLLDDMANYDSFLSRAFVYDKGG